jgi:hypothetical protein
MVGNGLRETLLTSGSLPGWRCAITQTEEGMPNKSRRGCTLLQPGDDDDDVDDDDDEPPLWDSKDDCILLVARSTLGLTRMAWDRRRSVISDSLKKYWLVRRNVGDPNVVWARRCVRVRVPCPPCSQDMCTPTPAPPVHTPVHHRQRAAEQV